ncbi:FAD-linked oxidase C-terminal domain-containing protein [Nocardioides sp. BP30]|uniref:FAD-binding oxidoreductase n=1 Tax=Nocardioides sp. BP30 TaxID=3036374 RepID=UPI00246855AD|nr:FAD-linked oxidase C-terminal domain-containing protein [Nocardioides sp. BP30]WGL52021.1 FAD-linked oxidase C-terminal domain-containing protein [Nocardioides sp. BP30]
MTFLGELRDEVSRLETGQAARERAAVDRSGAVPAGLPLAVVRARDVDDVRATLRLASRHRVPVVPRGAGTGLAGGALADEGAVVLDVSGMDRIVEIDPVDELAVVEPGVITAVLDAEAARHGLRYAPDPASAALSTIGGNIATNAGGMRCVKYGVTREAVLGLDVVLADGRLISTGRRTVKGVSGLDLTSLFVGSEGTLGVVVGASLRLRALPEQTLTAAAAFGDVAAAAQACVALAAARRRPSVLELLDGATLAVVDRAEGTDHATRGNALVIAQAEGPDAAEEIAAIADILGKEATWSERAVDPASSQRLLHARRSALPSIERFGRALIEDICVPRSRLADAFAGVRRIAAAHDVAIYSFAHAGDGNLHPIIGYDAPSAQPPAAVGRAADDIFALALELGGTVTGEHGIGLLKRDWLAREVGPDVLDVHASLKQALDPLAILNPGKGF